MATSLDSKRPARSIHLVSEERGAGQSARESAMAAASFVIVLLAVCALAISHPSVNWDVLPYTANVEAQHTTDFLAIYHNTYGEVRRHFSQNAFDTLTSETAHASKSYSDPVFFVQQLPFFSIRPLYIVLLRAASGAGVSPVVTARLMSGLALFVIGLTSFFWMQHHSSPWVALAASVLLSISYPILLLGRMHTPDGLSAAVLLLSVYLLIERRNLFWGILLLLLSVYVRTDNVILVGFVIAYLCFRRQLQWAHGIVLIALAAASVAVINTAGGNFGYAALFHSLFTDPLGDPLVQSKVPVTLAQYVSAFRFGVGQFLKSHAPEFFLLGSLALAVRLSPLRNLAWLAMAAVVAHFVIFPDFEDRFFGFTYAAFAIAATAALAEGRILKIARTPVVPS